MDLIWQKFTEWLKELLISGIMDNVNGLFDNVNSRVAGIAGQVSLIIESLTISCTLGGETVVSFLGISK